MEDKDRGAFSYELEQVSLRFGTRADFETYWIVLQFFALEDVAAALRNASEACEALPSASHMREYASTEERSRKSRSEELKATNGTGRSSSPVMETLAQKWEAQTSRLGLEGRPIPGNVAKDRWAEFWVSFDEACAGRVL